MNIKELKVGMEIKNYKELCSIIEDKIKSGASKRAQLKELERYCKYHKDGNKFIIDEIYLETKPRIDNRKNNVGGANNITGYTKIIEKLILDLLVQGNKSNSNQKIGKVFLSKNQLLKEFKMISENYVYCKRRIPKLAKFMNLNQDTVEEWYDINDDMLERNLNQSLKNLENQSLIFWSREITVAEIIPLAEVLENGTEIIKTKLIDEYGEEQISYDYYANSKVMLNYREGTDAEKAFILSTERNILKELNCTNKQKIIQMGMWDTFKTKVDSIVLKKLNIGFYYKSYKILFNEEHVFEAIEDINNFELNEKDKTNEQDTLNKEIINRSIENSIKRHDKAIIEKSKILGNPRNDFKYEKIKRRADKNYVLDNIKLNDTLIVQNALNIKDNVKEIKLNNNKISDKYIDELF